MTEQLKRFAGSGNIYTEIATRGSETLGIDLKYAVHQSGVGALIVRFAIHNSKVEYQPLTHFTLRGHSSYIPIADGKHDYAASFKGLRLNKVAIPVFNPAPTFPYLAAALDQFALWPVLGDWIVEQLKAEGFAPVTDVTAFLKQMLTAPSPDLTTIQMIVEFPDLTVVKAHEEYVAPPSSDDGEEEEEEADEDDEDEDTIN